MSLDDGSKPERIEGETEEGGGKRKYVAPVEI